MSLFVCDQCGVVENTAAAGLFGWWGRKQKPSKGEIARKPALEILGDGKARCSQCNPERGKWHGLFPREQWDGERPVNNR